MTDTGSESPVPPCVSVARTTRRCVPSATERVSQVRTAGEALAEPPGILIPSTSSSTATNDATGLVTAVASTWAFPRSASACPGQVISTRGASTARAWTIAVCVAEAASAVTVSAAPNRKGPLTPARTSVALSPATIRWGSKVAAIPGRRPDTDKETVSAGPSIRRSTGRASRRRKPISSPGTMASKTNPFCSAISMSTFPGCTRSPTLTSPDATMPSVPVALMEYPWPRPGSASAAAVRARMAGCPGETTGGSMRALSPGGRPATESEIAFSEAAGRSAAVWISMAVVDPRRTTWSLTFGQMACSGEVAQSGRRKVKMRVRQL